ncbi:hypothetical protein GYMLUDRAFT_824047 [Collybiopsis luxurians FD-317 M1]|uniref:Uncharacterized protein n=1 Tax=Collybiopsis luxurians FD-317 M1 TaxID=944289 RepID=A0A0D0BMH2_9AGAR|nr:hypothetical protein GYMLUDRAFT_824047 [Collybiopsis luxurians FD-317 M1]
MRRQMYLGFYSEYLVADQLARTQCTEREYPLSDIGFWERSRQCALLNLGQNILDTFTSVR